MASERTRRVERSWRRPRRDAGPALLRFFPLPAEDRFELLRLDEPVTLGRSPSCSWPLDDTEISREHARVLLDGQARRIVDLDSANGLFVNGERVAALTLADGDVIRVGSSLLRFFAQAPKTRGKAPAIHRGRLLGGPSLARVERRLTRAADSDLAVLICGETGTGKELAAREIHRRSGVSGGPFVAVNCGAIAADVIEAELFGHAKGAFTGADRDREGLVAAADGGTLFFDEIGEMPEESQAKLLRVLQEKKVRPVGATQARPVRIRLVSATNRDLGERIEQGGFRADLYARIADVVIELPPLRARREDIPLLARHFLEKHGAGDWSLPTEVAELLSCLPWPLNVRQLESAVRRAIVMSDDGEQLTPDDFAELSHGVDHSVGQRPPSRPPWADRGAVGAPRAAAAGDAAGARSAADRRREEDEETARIAEELDRVLREHAGDVAAAAAALGISRSQLYRRAQTVGIRPRSYRR